MQNFLDALARAILGRPEEPQPVSAISLTTELKRRTWFETYADTTILPAFEALAAVVRQHGHDAHIERLVEGSVLFARLEIRRMDHPQGQPLPFISFSLGQEGQQIEVNYGGVVPGPADQNHIKAEVSWKSITPEEVMPEIAKFARHVFRSPESSEFAHSGER